MSLGYVGAGGAAGGQAGFDHWMKTRLEAELEQKRQQQQDFENAMRVQEFTSGEELKRLQLEGLNEGRASAADARLVTEGIRVGDQMAPGSTVRGGDPSAPGLRRVGLLRTQGSAMQIPDSIALGPDPVPGLGGNVIEEDPGTVANAPLPQGSPGRLFTKLPSANQTERAVDNERADAQLRRQEAHDETMAEQADKRLAAMQANRGSLTENQQANYINTLSKAWQSAYKPVKQLDQQLALMDAGIKAVQRGDRAQGDQAILVTFQKILDPNSVVRESEYDRSAAGLALNARVRGLLEQWQQGGAGMSAVEVMKFARLAREAAAAQRTGYVQAERARMGRLAKRFQIPEELVFADSTGGAEDATPTPEVAVGTPPSVRSTVTTYDINGNEIKAK